jgi:hypothetical protein
MHHLIILAVSRSLRKAALGLREAEDIRRCDGDRAATLNTRMT